MTIAPPIVWKGAEKLRPFLLEIFDLEPWPGNPRQGDIDEIRASLERFGQLKSIVVDRMINGPANPARIVAGHHVVLAAAAAGWTHVAALENEFGSDAEARAFLVADNRTSELGTTDAALLSAQLDALRENSTLDGTGYTEGQADLLRAELERLRRAANKPNPDVVPAAPATPVTKPGEIFELGDHRLMCGDSTNPDHVAALLGGRRTSLIFTSPPYGVGLDYGDTYEDTIDAARVVIAAVAEVWREHVDPGGYAIVNFADVISARGYLGEVEPCEYPMVLEYWPAFRSADWLLHSRRIWAKPHAKVSAPWTANSNRAACDWEHLWIWKRPGAGLTERRGNSPLGVWDTSHAPGVDVGKDEFPAAMPAVLPSWTFDVYSNPGDLIVDPFGGTGTTMIAGEMTVRPTALMEISPASCDIIRKRYAIFTGRPELEHAPAVETVEVADDHAEAPRVRDLPLRFTADRLGEAQAFMAVMRRELERPDADPADLVLEALRRTAASF